MAKAIEEGLPKMRIEEAAARKQAKIDSGTDQIIGVNVFRVKDETQIDVLQVDNTAVRKSQIDRINEVKDKRDESKTVQALEALAECAKSGKGNLLALSIEAARQRATLGEISDAMEKSFGRYQAKHKTISGVYLREIASDESFKNCLLYTSPSPRDKRQSRMPSSA